MKFGIIIGSAKSGTTSLFSYLSEHPSICECYVKEPRYFSTDDIWKNGLDWYKKLWNWDPNKHKIALEATPLYSCYPTYPLTVERMNSSGLNFKFIYILRDPIERIESHLSFDMLYEGFNNGYNRTANSVPKHLIDYSKYFMQLEEYTKIFDLNNIKIIDFTELKTNPLKLLNDVTEFLELDYYEYKNYDVKHNESTGKFYPHPYWIKLRKNNKLKIIATKIIPYNIRSKINNKLGKVLDQNIKLTETQREYVINELEYDLKSLKKHYNFDIDKWNLI